MSRAERAAELWERARKHRADAAWMQAACAGEKTIEGEWRKLAAAVLELRAMIWLWPR